MFGICEGSTYAGELSDTGLDLLRGEEDLADLSAKLRGSVGEVLGTACGNEARRSEVSGTTEGTEGDERKVS